MINFEITESATKKLEDTLLSNEKLRIAIKGGGCAGFEYDFQIEKDIGLDIIGTENNNTDMTFNFGRISILIDPISAQYLNNSVLDYVSEQFKSQFVLKNPNANITCGCGKSFAG